MTLKQKRKQRNDRRENLARSIALTYDSLQSHLCDSVKTGRLKSGNEEFHARCVREYAEVIYTISVELHELTKMDFKAEFLTSLAKR